MAAGSHTLLEPGYLIEMIVGPRLPKSHGGGTPEATNGFGHANTLTVASAVPFVKGPLAGKTSGVTSIVAWFTIGVEVSPSSQIAVPFPKPGTRARPSPFSNSVARSIPRAKSQRQRLPDRAREWARHEPMLLAFMAGALVARIAFWLICPRFAARAAAIAGAIVAPWIVFTFLFYGSPVPNTVIAKSTVNPTPPILASGSPLPWLEWLLGQVAGHITLLLYHLEPFHEVWSTAAAPLPGSAAVGDRGRHL